MSTSKIVSVLVFGIVFLTSFTSVSDTTVHVGAPDSSVSGSVR